MWRTRQGRDGRCGGKRRARRDAAETATATGPAVGAAAMLLRLRGIGPEFATTLASEELERHFDNRRQVGSYAGLAPTPWRSGRIDHEQEVSKAGNPRLHAAMVQLEWLWLQHQPDTALVRWYLDKPPACAASTPRSGRSSRWRASC